MAPEIAMAEGKKKAGPKALAHIEIHPKMGGGHIVRHQFEGYSHEAKEYHFKKDAGEEMLAHVARHVGAKPVKAEGSMHENEKDIATESEGRKGYKTKGKKALPSTFYGESRSVATPSR